MSSPIEKLDAYAYIGEFRMKNFYLFVLILLALACSESSLEPIPPEPPKPLNQYLQISGKYCADPPEEKAFPIKILIVVDQSTSLQCTDSQNRRVRTLSNLVNRLSLQNNVEIGFVGFANWSRLQPFTANPQEVQTFLDPAQGLGPATDYQGALSSAIQLLEADMIKSGPALRARSKYVVIFMSDGSPEPKCRLGCEDDSTKCTDGIDNDGDALIDNADEDCMDVDDNSLRPDNLYGVCNTDSEIPEGIYVDMSGRCPAYNQPEQIEKKIEDLRTLEKLYGVGDLVMHTILLSSPQMVIESVCPMASESFGYNTDLARDLLGRMALAGGGSFRDVNLESEDQNYLDFDYGSLKSPYLLRELIAYNDHRIADENAYWGAIADSDGDGLSDALEFEIKSNPNLKDSDFKQEVGITRVDGYSDGFEQQQKLNGFDPTDINLPAQKCQTPVDRDGDGLNDCEENFLGTDPLNEDSDGDFILDGLEFRNGLNPLIRDGEEDLDFDGVLNRMEIKTNLNPKVPEQRKDQIRVKYQIEEKGISLIPQKESQNLEERSCYAFQINDVPLVPTRNQSNPKQNGDNRILIYGLSQPLNLNDAQAKARIACLDVYFEDETHKYPSAEIKIDDQAWDALRNELYLLVDQISDCFGVPFVMKKEVESLVSTCLKPKTQIGQFLRDQESILNTLSQFFDDLMYLKLPMEASDLFVPIAGFNPDQDCLSYRGLEEIKNVLKVLAQKCESCDQIDEIKQNSATNSSNK